MGREVEEVVGLDEVLLRLKVFILVKFRRN